MKTKILITVVIIIVAALVLSISREDRDEKSTYEPTPNESEDISTSSESTSGVPGANYTLAQISSHKNAASCYSAIDGSVYDLTRWIEAHPGGVENILILCGRDGTKEFKEQHGTNDEALKRLASFKIGTLR